MSGLIPSSPNIGPGGGGGQKFDLFGLIPADNPVFSGGFGLAVLAAGAQVLRSSSSLLMTMAKRHLLITLEVTSKDRAYPWVLQWLSHQKFRNQHLSVETAFKTRANGAMTMFDLVPGPGNHFISYRGKVLNVQRIREPQMVDLNSGKPWEKVQFIGFGRDTKVFNALLEEAILLANMQEEGKTIVYTNWGTEWRPFGQPRRRRPLESVILDEGIADRLIGDVLKWRDSSAWYLERGIPYRRGYLLYGPPGSGKTSFITALAGRLGYNICILNLAERGLTDDRLALAMSNVPPQSIVLLEDIDAAFPKRDDASGASSKSLQHNTSDVTLSGLLNTLDGVASSEERLIFMTTNHVDRLDSALIRPGRVDLMQFVGDATHHQIFMMAKRFYPEQGEEGAQKIADKLKHMNASVSMAKLQGYFVQHANDYQSAYEHLQTLLGSPSDSESRPFITIPSRNPTGSTSTSTNTTQSHASGSGANGTRRSPSRRTMTAEELDKMVFNPQEGWDSGILDITPKR